MKRSDLIDKMAQEVVEQSDIEVVLSVFERHQRMYFDACDNDVLLEEYEYLFGEPLEEEIEEG